MDNNLIDHLLFGGPDLDTATDQIHQALGVQPLPGGSHPGKGTRNSLLGLSHGAYLEVIGPDPDQTVDKVWMNLDQAAKPSLFRWAAKCSDLEALTKRAQEASINLGEIQTGQRKQSDGTLLQWKLTNPDIVLADGLIPFFIDWDTNGNPSANLPHAGKIIQLYGKHPNPDKVLSILNILGIDMPVYQGNKAELCAEININGATIHLR